MFGAGRQALVVGGSDSDAQGKAQRQQIGQGDAGQQAAGQSGDHHHQRRTKPTTTTAIPSRGQ